MAEQTSGYKEYASKEYVDDIVPNLHVDEEGDAVLGTTVEVDSLPEPVPSYEESDEGKALSVVNGNMAWSNLKTVVASDTEPTDNNVLIWIQTS